MQLERIASEQMSPSSMQFCAPGAGPTWWQVRQSRPPCSQVMRSDEVWQETACRNT